MSPFKKEIFACPICNFQDWLENLPDCNQDIHYCPNCKKGAAYHLLIPLQKYLEKKKKEELAKQIYCRGCGHMGPIESFPFDLPPDEDGERRCPQCGSDRCINASNLPLCASCKQLPVEKEGDWCDGCWDMMEAAYAAEQDARDIF